MASGKKTNLTSPNGSVAHSVYGLRIASNLAIPGLFVSASEGVPDIIARMRRMPEVCSAPFTQRDRLLYVSSTSDSDGLPGLQVRDIGTYFEFRYRDGARFAVSHTGDEIWGDWPEDCTLESASTYLLGPVLGFVLRLRGFTCLHASAILCGNDAVAFIGPHGAGKSTTAAAFAVRGFPVLADDVVALALLGEEFVIHPGYPRVNLWPDSVRSLMGTADALPPIAPPWEKRFMGLDERTQFASKAVQLRAIYFLGERDTDSTAVKLEAMNGCDALVNLIGNTYVNPLLDAAGMRRDFEILGKVVANIPVRRVRRGSDLLKLSALCDAVAADVMESTYLK